MFYLLFFILGALFLSEKVPAGELEQKLVEMRFDTGDAHGWMTGGNCHAALKDGLLHIEARGGEPTLSRTVDRIGGRIRLVVRIRTRTESTATVYWTTRSSPGRSEEKKVVLTLKADGDWHDYEFQLSVPDVLTGVSLRLSASKGTWEFESITAYRNRKHPLMLRGALPYRHENDPTERLRYTIYNDAVEPLTFGVEHVEDEVSLAGRHSLDFAVPLQTEGSLATARLQLHPKRFPSISFPVFLYRPENKVDWISLSPLAEKASWKFEVAPDARMARIRVDDETVAIIAPIAHRDGVIPRFVRLPDSTESKLLFDSDETRLEIEMLERSVRFRIEEKTEKEPASSTEPDESREKPKTVLPEGPVVRLFGRLRSGLLPGVEFLGPGDVSSSTLDIAEPNNERSRPDPFWLTMPLAVQETEKGAVILHWKNTTLRPTFSSPNRFDWTNDHRMSLSGTKIETTLWFLEPASENDEPATIRALRLYVAENGFPQPPQAPRTAEQQRLLDLQALQNPLQAEDGIRWGYAVETDWPRKPYADQLSTLARLTGRPSNPQTISPGGADIANDAIYFLTGRVEEWKKSRLEAIQSILSLKNPDGSFFYRTRFPDVETGSTSHGYTAIKALELMEYVRLTGDAQVFEAVRQSLDFLKRCDVPRGGFYRDAPFHTPDLQTAATLVWLYAWAFEESGEPEYLELAKRYAYCGLPFVYQWSDREIMLYACVPRLGGTNRELPLWFGVAQPRVGIVYAYGLNILAQHDPTVDWRRIASGILHATEQMQYSEGPDAGCIPDVFVLRTGERRSWRINPCAAVSLRLALDGKIDSLFVLKEENRRLVAPFPLRNTPNGIVAEEVPAGAKFQILRNGNRISSSQGSGPIPQD